MMTSPFRRFLMVPGLLAAACGTLSACSSSHDAYRPDRAVCIREGKDAPVPQIRMGDAATINRILDEGKNRNQVMNHLRHLTQEIGPRLTASSNAEKANHWTLEQFQSWGLDATLFKWGEFETRFDRGPSTGKLYTKSKTKKEDGSTEETWKSVRDLEFTTLAWTRGTNGPQRGPVIKMPESDEEYAKVKDSLKGAWVLLEPVSIEGRGGVRGPGQRAGDRFKSRIEARARAAKGEDVSKFALEDRVLFDGILGFISSSTDQRDRVWTTAVPDARTRKADDIPPDVEVIVRLADHDNMLVRMQEKQDFQIEFDLPHTLTPGPIPLYDTVAEIRGTEKPDEVVVVCGHLDSWNGPGSQGCTDNGTGSMVALEAARILMAAHAKPKRTIRFILWTGEEQGLLGSASYVKSLGDDIKKVSVCLNDDGGTNYEGGIKCTADMADYLAAATAPVNNQFYDFMDGKPLNVNIQVVEKFIRGGSSDHASFTAAGAPGFFYDEVGRADYGWGWHTQHDRLDLAIREYLEQSSTCQAITAYNMACAPELLPRVPPLPPEDPANPRPRRNRGGAAPSAPSPGATPAPASGTKS
jgi:carboxypeptidase Q